MHTKSKPININAYLDFAQLLKEYRGRHEENRVFALKHKELLKQPNNLLLEWLKQHAFRVKGTLNSSTFSYYSSTVNNFVGFFSLLMGIFFGIGLLSYSGYEPVNIIYYLFFAILLPVISMVITLLSMLGNKGIFGFFARFFPLFWLEKLFNFGSFKEKIDFFEEIFSSQLQKWLFIHRLQLFSLLFSLGLLLSLLFIVISQDIAFSWSTTLQISAMGFHQFLEFLALPWNFFFPSLMPSVELVELSQHYRLGEHLTSTMIDNADKLGAWWKYLALTTFAYAIVLRLSLLLFANYGVQKILEKDFLELDGVNKLLREFQTPFVSTKAPKKEKHLEIAEEKRTRIKKFVAPPVKLIEEKNIEDKREVSQKEEVVEIETPKAIESKTEEKIEIEIKKSEEAIKSEEIKSVPLPEVKVEISKLNEVKNEVLKIVDTLKEPKVIKEVEPQVVEEASIEEEYLETIEYIEDNYHNIIGWNFSFDEILLVNDSKNLTALTINSVGGSHSFLEDEKVAMEASRKVLLYVKSWEPPTMDFVDFLEEIIENREVDEIQVFPLGTRNMAYESSLKELAIWNRKIEGLKSKKVWVIDAE